MTEVQLLEKRIDSVHMMLEQPLSEWAQEYWSGVLMLLVRKLNTTRGTVH